MLPPKIRHKTYFIRAKNPFPFSNIYINFSDEEDNETDNAMNYVETAHNVKQE